MYITTYNTNNYKILIALSEKITYNRNIETGGEQYAY